MGRMNDYHEVKENGMRVKDKVAVVTGGAGAIGGELIAGCGDIYPQTGSIIDDVERRC